MSTDRVASKPHSTNLFALTVLAATALAGPALSAEFPAVLKLSSLNGAIGFLLDGIDAYDLSGRSVSSAGDVNGDGFDDIMIGAPYANSGAASDEGESYVVFGKASFAGTSAINFSSLNGTTGFRLDGIDAHDRSGSSVSSAGDVNGDGFDDIVIGAPFAEPGAALSVGESYVVFGRAPDGPRNRVGSATGQYISGGAFVDTLSALGGNDGLEGRGGGDNLQGGTGAPDLAVYLHAPTGVIANLTAPGGNTGHAAGDTYTGIEGLEGSRFNDTLTGNTLGNLLIGNGGNDTLRGLDGPDTIFGGLGRDLMTGGTGNNTYAFTRLAESVPTALRDSITDYKPGTAGTFADRIDVRGIDARTAVPGNQAFVFIGTGPFTTTGQLRVALFGTNIVVHANTGGTLASDFQILLQGLTDLTAFGTNDFLK